MNCQETRELLIDLVYDELAPPEHAPRRAAVEAHLAACPTCREELAQLRAARAALATHRAGEPIGVTLPAPAAAAARANRAPFWRRWAPAVAAILLISLLLWMWWDSSAPPLHAQPQPVEIRRLGVSLTILSTPEHWPAPGAWVKLEGQKDYSSYPGWPGLALVRDERMVRNLGPGQSRVSFTDVPAGIKPDTVRLRTVAPADAVAILEQNYQYDLASASAILQRYVDQPIALTYKDGQSDKGVLLSFDQKSLVIRPQGQGPRTVTRKDIAAVALASLPQGLLTRPTLVWELDNKAAQQPQQFEVAYMTAGLSSRTDYVLHLHPANAAHPETKPADALPGAFPGAGALPGGEITDTADLVGYATVTNNSGVTYENAQLKLMAGDVNLIRPEEMMILQRAVAAGAAGLDAQQPPQFQEKSFFEYHLYTLGRATTLGNAETKQIEMVTGQNIGLKRGYVYDPQQDNPTAPRVVSQMKNSQANGLGKPLPKGVIRLYAPDPEGQETYVAQTTIDHTPVDEMVRLPWGHAFDIACRFTATEFHRSGSEVRYEWRYELRNHKDHDVTVTVVAHVEPATYQAQCNFPWHIREVGVIEIEVPVKAGSAATVTLKHSVNYDSGGGLRSPFDEKK